MPLPVAIQIKACDYVKDLAPIVSNNTSLNPPASPFCEKQHTMRRLTQAGGYRGWRPCESKRHEQERVVGSAPNAQLGLKDQEHWAKRSQL